MIWCVEDDPSIRELETYVLNTTGLEACGFEDGQVFWETLQEKQPDLVLLDVMLPGIDGVELLTRMKAGEKFRDIPVIMATAKGTEYDKVQSLDLGADDYLVKSFGMMEMVSRVKAVLRRCQPKASSRLLKLDELVLDLEQHTVSIAGERVVLTYKEYELLKLFLPHPGVAFTREQLLQKIWNTDYVSETRTVDMHIRTLRQKLGGLYMTTYFFKLVSLLGGLALFLFGMDVMGKALERQAGGKLQTILAKMSSNVFKGFLLGLGVTAVIQSSSATTVMVVGFVNSGIMTLKQAVGVIMGSNIGTTVTAWILSLSGLEGDSFIIKLFKPSTLAPLIGIIGIVLYMGKNEKKKGIGTICLGFMALMTGMDLMSGSMSFLKTESWFAGLMISFSNPIVGILFGAALTAIIQSSSASVGILQSLCVTGAVTYGSAIPIILGQNIGTCVTAMMGAIGANRNARRTAVVHLMFNVVGAVMFSVMFYGLGLFIDWTFLNDPVKAWDISVIHTGFNVIATCVLMPLNGLLVKLAYLIIPSEVTPQKEELLDERLLATPAVAVQRAHEIASQMAADSAEVMNLAIGLIEKFDAAVLERIIEIEDRTDRYTVAEVTLNGENRIRVQSEGYSVVEIDLCDLSVCPEEQNTTAALIRGVAAAFAQRGAKLEGFDARVRSSVLPGSGLSSSAAFEVLMGTICNELFFEGKCSAVEIAQIGQYAENVYFGKPCGLMDQMASSVGGMVFIDFEDPQSPVVERIDFDFSSAGHALCIIDSGADHADLTDEYAAIPGELGKICAFFGCKYLRQIPLTEFYEHLGELRAIAGDRAVLRAIHVYDENKRVLEQKKALEQGDFDKFLSIVTESGLSSWRLLQNVVPAGQTAHQEVAFALTVAEKLLNGRGACRVHGGGFAGTIQAFVPNDLLEEFKNGIESVLGQGSCHVLSIRNVGGCRVNV